MKHYRSAFLFCLGLVAAHSAPAYEITAYKARIVPDIAAKSLSGTTRIYISTRVHDAPEFSFALNGLNVSAVDLNGKAVPFTGAEGRLKVAIPHAMRARSVHLLSVHYSGRPAQGLVFGPDFVHSVFSTCHWMICDDAPAIKALIELEVVVPAHYDVVASGEPVSTNADGAGMRRHLWRESRPYSSYLFGFAVGKFQQAEAEADGVHLAYYGIGDDPATLLRKFSVSKEMHAFLLDKAGLPMPHKRYRQVLIPGNAAQEMSSFSVIGTDMLDPILANPQEDWVIVHEMAHQWWGNLITCKEWRDFWLNEGLTVFMVAAYKEQRWGAPAYEAEMALARKRYQHALDAGFDKPLSFAGEYPTLRLRRAISYSKGALFFDALRRELGDATFWAGLRRYTRDNAGRSVTSRDFQEAMEKTAGRSLAPLFAQWVY
ncbi:MAG: M1 family metallopeptidase [Pseudomonadota bacterium]